MTDEGWSRRDVEAALRDRTLQRVVRGVYAIPEGSSSTDRHRLTMQALRTTLHPDAVFSHASAAVLHGLPLPTGALDTVHVTRTGGVHGRRTRNVRVHVAVVADAELTVRDGLPCTGLARTVTDLARTLEFGWGVAAADHALRRGLPRPSLATTGDARRRRGTSHLDAVARFADGRAASPLESRSRVFFAGAGLPRPVLQFLVEDPADGWRAVTDFAWPEFRLVGEADGRTKYGEGLRDGETAADAVMAEKAREQRIRDLDWRVVRWSWRECHDGTMLRRVRRALIAEGWRPTAECPPS